MSDGVRRLDVATDELTNVGNNLKGVYDEVSSIFSKVVSINDQVTSNESWKSEASTTYNERFQACKSNIDADLEALSLLGPTINEASDQYETTEASNVSRLNNLDRVE